MNSIWAAGLMSGTSLDGTIDVALIKTDGIIVEKFSSFKSYTYSDEVRESIKESVEVAREWNFKGPEPELFKLTEELITVAQADAVNDLIEGSPIDKEELGVVGFHGQTILHKPPRHKKKGRTRQLGNGPLMSEILKTKVVYDFRSADMLVGGHGAPLCPSYHRALLASLINKDETAVLNLGGTGNITWCYNGEDLIAFDTGPASAPINDLVAHFGLGDMDRDGLLASKGIVNNVLLNDFLNNPYFDKKYPKSLDRYDFSNKQILSLSVEDGAATLTRLCAESVFKALNILPRRPKNLIVCGGGRHNPVLLQEIKEITNIEVFQAEEFGWRGDAIEAECFGFLAVRSINDLPISFPMTTGVDKEMSGGQVCYPKRN